MRTDSDDEYINGLLMDRGLFEGLVSESGFVELPYTIRAANLRRSVQGTLRLLPASPGG